MGKVVVYMLTVLVLNGVLTGLAVAETFKFYAVEDSWVNQANPDANYGSNSYLSVKDRSGAGWAFLKFSADDVLSLQDWSVEGVSLWLYQYQSTFSPGDQINFHGVAQDWHEDSLSWANLPPVYPASAVSGYLAEGNECWREFSGLEGLVEGWYNADTYGVCLENSLDAQANELFVRFYSSEAELERRPYLSISAVARGIDVKAAPEPVSSVLFAGGGLLLTAVRKRFRNG